MSPADGSRKDERQYEDIKESEQQDGRSMVRAKEIAARTVNKRRRKEGRTAKAPPSRRSARPHSHERK